MSFSLAAFGVDVDQHAVGGLSLAAVAGHRVAVIEMRIVCRR